MSANGYSYFGKTPEPGEEPRIHPFLAGQLDQMEREQMYGPLPTREPSEREQISETLRAWKPEAVTTENEK